MRLFNFLDFRLQLGFVNIYPQNIFFQNCPNLGGGGSKKKRSIRTILRLPRRRRSFENKRSHLFQHDISKILKRFPNTKGTFLVFRNFFGVSVLFFDTPELSQLFLPKVFHFWQSPFRTSTYYI